MKASMLGTAYVWSALAIGFLLMGMVHAQTFQVIHSFGVQGGRNPSAGLTIDRGGNLYGTTNGGGAADAGTVFKLAPRESGWIFNTLYSFTGGSDGSQPDARVIFGPDGALYSTTSTGGIGCESGCGTVFKLMPPATICKTTLCSWRKTILYQFSGGFDGVYPEGGDLVFDEAGNIYGTTYGGGTGYGVVFELMPSGMESVLYPFSGGHLAYPASGVIFDNAGNLYGATPNQGGALYQLTPSGSGWTENTLYLFNQFGNHPFGGLIFDRAGDIFGTTSNGPGSDNGGTAFKVTSSNGTWALSTIYGFTGVPLLGPDCGPWASLAFDTAGNLYGTTRCDGVYGSVFRLTNNGGSWTYTRLHAFTGGSDGAYPTSNVVFDTSGNLYGTASAGGLHDCVGSPYQGCGLVWEITP